MTEPRPLVRIVEDDAAVRDSLVALAESWGYEAEAFPDAEAFAEAPPRPALCVLLDVKLPRSDGIEALGRLRASDRTTPVILLTGHGNVRLAVQALQAGAQDVIEKPYDGAELMRRIAELGEAARGDGEETARFGALTPREREVLVEIVAGHSTKMIAHRLGLSPKTVEVHRARILSKTGAGNLSTLVRLAIKAGIEPVAESDG